MNFKIAHVLAIASIPMLAACATDTTAFGGEPASKFGEANRQTMMAQVIDPDPDYEFSTPDTSADHAAQAIERYRTDSVKEPESIKSTEGGQGGS